MPAKLDRCVADVKAKGGVDNPWAVCNASLKESEDRIKSQVASTMAERGMTESHNPLDIPFGYEVDETVSIPSGASAISIGAKKKVDEIKIDKVSENVLKQILETQLRDCTCKNKSRPRV